jgi:hypothetical protein
VRCQPGLAHSHSGTRLLLLLLLAVVVLFQQHQRQQQQGVSMFVTS